MTDTANRFQNMIPCHSAIPEDSDATSQLLHYYYQSLLYAPVDLMVSYHYARLTTSLQSQSSSVLYTHVLQWYYFLRYFLFQEINDNEYSHVMVSWMRENAGKQIGSHPFEHHPQLYMPPHQLVQQIKTYSHVVCSNPLSQLMTAYHHNIKMPCKYDARFSGLALGSFIKAARPLPLSMYKTPITDSSYSVVNLIQHHQDCTKKIKSLKENKKRSFDADMMDLE